MRNISRSKGRQAVKFGQLTEHNVRIYFFKNHAEKEVARLVPNLFLFFEKVLCRGKSFVRGKSK